MHTVDLLAATLELLQRAGYGIREESLGGGGGGACEIAGRKWLFLDLEQSVAEKLETALDTIRDDPELAGIDLPGELRHRIGDRRAA